MKIQRRSLVVLLGACVAAAALAGCSDKSFTIEAGAFQGPFYALAPGVEASEQLAVIDTDADGVPDTAVSQYLYQADGNTVLRGMFNFAPYYASESNAQARGGGINPSLATSGGVASTTSDASGDADNRIRSDGDNDDDESGDVDEDEEGSGEDEEDGA